VSATLALPSWAVVKPARAEHIARVVALARGWAGAMSVGPGETRRWERAALLHDALRDATPEQLQRYTPRGDWPPALWHGPAAAAAAAAGGETDAGVLSAIRYHSVGYREWDACGRILFLADYLEPGRTTDRAELDALAARAPRELDAVVRDVTARRIAHLLRVHKPVRTETWELWNSLVAAAS
jgi:HD superfamily phosphohydrolase YqeK